MMVRLSCFLAASVLLLSCAPITVDSANLTKTFKDCAECPEMVLIPSGSFLMGGEGGEKGRPEGPVREVSVQKFAIAAYEVTQAQFAEFIKSTGYVAASNCRLWPDERMKSDEVFDWENPGYVEGSRPDYPAACISWLDAKAYVAWLSDKTGEIYRLPSEAEWEYAARGGTQTNYHWGNDPEQGCAFANMNDAESARNNFPWKHSICSDGYREASPVGSFPPNDYGVYDMVGNVWEWTEDCYVLYYKDAPVDGTALTDSKSCDRRSVRGGSWMTRPDRNRLSFRGRDPVETSYFMFGFRVARDLRAGTQ